MKSYHIENQQIACWGEEQHLNKIPPIFLELKE